MKHFKIIAFFTIIICFAETPFSQDKDVAVVLKTKGSVEFNNTASKAWKTAKRGVRLNSGDNVRTSQRSFAGLVFTDDKSLLKIRPNSNIKIQGKREEEGIIKKLSLAFGEIWAKVTKQNTSLRVETPSGVATVKGTIFNALYEDGNFIIFCQEGLMELFNQFGTLLLGENEMARIVQGAPPERIVGDPNDIFTMDDEEEARQLEIEFEDEDGNKKILIIDFK